MAEAIVSVLVEQLGNFLYHEIENEVTMVVGVKKEVQKLTKTLTAIQAVLYDAETKQFKEKRVKVWLEDLKEAVYEIEDVLDQWNTKILKSQIKRNSLGSSEKACSHLLYPCFCIENTVFSRHSVGRKIKEISESLESIERRKDAFGLASRFEAEISQPREITSSLIVSKTYGRDKDRDIIVNRIIDENSHGRAGAFVVSIIGIGGLGKTTLAQLVSQDTSIKQRFGKPLWVCVSDPFDRTRLAKAIISAVSGEEVSDKIEWDALHHRLMETLKDKLFLLILDDVWTENTNHWDPLKVCLDGGAAGSMILVTTRNEQVARMMSSVYSHPLEGLTEKKGWALFKSAALIDNEAPDYKFFDEIGKAIVLKCKGVPLSIKTLGSMLRFKKTNHWKRVLESEMWSLEEFVDTVNPALSLSYYDLPSSWKPCFMYCATFPKDHILEKDVLIKLWMAHGFLYSSESRELEEIGEDYFNGIISRSLFQDVVKNDVGDIQSCKMHDLVHDFVHFFSNNTKLHHLTVCSSDKDITTVSSFGTMKSVRTLNLNNECEVGGVKKILRHWINLRSLDISRTALDLLPSEIEKLVHLRYLDLSHNWKLNKLPNTLGNLCYLQTLKLNQCSSLRGLPASMGKLINLRHLELDGTINLRSLPKGIEKLHFLRSLSKFIVEEGRKLNDLKSLNLIQGRIEISGLSRVTDGDEAKEAELGSKRGIRDLTLIFENYETVSEGYEERMEGVLEALQPPPELEELCIMWYPGSKLAIWMNDRFLFLKLRVLLLKFDKENKCTQVPSLGQLPLLEELRIYNMKSLQRLDLIGICESKEDASNPIVVFPKLIRLELINMIELEEWVLPFERSDIIKIMPCLRILTIHYAYKLKTLPAVWKLESLEQLRISSTRSLQRLDLFGISENKEDASKPILLFPNLIQLQLMGMFELEEWVLPFERSDIIQIMPRLRTLYVFGASKLIALPAVWKLESLEELTLSGLESVRRIGPKFFGISKDDVMDMNRAGESLPIIIFPNLKKLEIQSMQNLKKWEMKMPNWRDNITFFMPYLQELNLKNCPKLKVIPQNIFSNQLVKEQISDCPELKLPYDGINKIIKRKEVGESSMTNEERTSVHSPSEVMM